jgi:deazaflavin-dependent oxidoreductase (nitroreductase family)
MLGRRTVLLEHTGRKSGLPRETVLEVIRHDDQSFDIAAAYGAKSDWVRNIEADPKVRISTGRIQHAEATAVLADMATAKSAFADYTAAKAFGKSLGLPLDDPARMAAVVPVVRITLTTAADA